MDLSVFIFVALAVAWAAYLIPQAISHHDEVDRSRTVDRFSHTMRVLARREPVSDRDARLVVPGEAAPAPPTPAQVRASRTAAKVAAKRRRRVLGTLLLATAAVAGSAGFGLVHWAYVGIPAGLIIVWLVLCRVMVRSEIRADSVLLGRPSPQSGSSATAADQDGDLPEEYAVARNEQGFDEVAATADTSVSLPVTDPDAWDPVPTTLPTYVTKPAATRRTVRTIDLDSTGVWTSGHTDADSALARQADAERSARKVDETEHRAVGSCAAVGFPPVGFPGAPGKRSLLG
ncbi:hypothetical protein [Nocardioides sp.]|uniref:divisome protein SepX/GlpR n=1 Tax=Nocardioides sp. TaxID=35761 RepID=UPI002736FCE5|nr:hypothetical protein [Nocardioides sp.]MDP3893199.1 hypothetical protein [Nocardioides sp.]